MHAASDQQQLELPARAQGARTGQAAEPLPGVHPDPLPETASLLLDILRFGLAMLVVVGHVTLPWFCTGCVPLLGYANLAVPAFFVLSGFMIRYVTGTRERAPSRYWISRASRIFSVVLPACAVTLVADAVSFRADPVLYQRVTGPLQWNAVPLHVLAHLLFVTQLWNHSVLLLSNLPMWSLGYEVPYYVLFGLITFLRGPLRIVAVTLTSFLYGPQILLLLPLWWSGCWLYDLWQWCRAPERSIWPRTAISAGCLLMLAILLIPVAGMTGFRRIEITPNPLDLLHMGTGRASMYEFAAGLLAWATMFLALSASELFQLRKNTTGARAVRLVADSTFALYLFHYPLLLLARSLALYRPDRSADKVALLFSIVAFCVAAAVPIDRFKRRLRLWLEQLHRRHAGGPAKPRYS